MSGKLSGRIAVVSGAAGGIGRAIAERLAAEGADIAVADLAPATDTNATVVRHGRRFLSATCDVSQPDQVHAFARRVRSELGPADIVVNNAGIMKKIPFEQLTVEDWTRFFSVNVTSQFLMASAFIDDLKRSTAGRIINMSSTVLWTNVPQFVHYTTTKAAVMGFTSALATDLGRYGITVNAIAPSLIRTPGSGRLDDAERDYQMLPSMQVLQREQTPDDLTGTVAFLASDDAAFMTGQILAVDGGLTRR